MCPQIEFINNQLIPGISWGQKSSQAGHCGSDLPLKYLATHGLCIFMPHVGFSQIWHWKQKRKKNLIKYCTVNKDSHTVTLTCHLLGSLYSYQVGLKCWRINSASVWKSSKRFWSIPNPRWFTFVGTASWLCKFLFLHHFNNAGKWSGDCWDHLNTVKSLVPLCMPITGLNCWYEAEVSQVSL